MLQVFAAQVVYFLTRAYQPKTEKIEQGAMESYHANPALVLAVSVSLTAWV